MQPFKQQRDKMERNAVFYRGESIQKCALHIILGEDYTGYEAALEMTSCVSLEARRMQICEKFAVKTARSNKCSHWFVPNVRNAESRNTRHMTK